MILYGPAWFGFVGLMVVATWVGHMALRGRTQRTQRSWLIGLAVFNVICSTWFTFDLILDPDVYFPFTQNFPLHFCTLMTFLTVPAIWFDWRFLRALAYFPGVLTGFLGVVSPAPVYQGQAIVSATTLYYSVHALNAALPVLMGSLRLYSPRLRDAGLAMVWFLAVAVAMLPVTLLLRAVVDAKANYFFFFDPEGAGILQVLWDLIKVPVLYEAPLIPIATAVFYGQYGLYRLGCRIGRRLTRLTQGAASTA